MEASQVSWQRIPRELERFSRTRGPTGEFEFDEGTVEVTYGAGDRASSSAVFKHDYGRCFVCGGAYMGVIDRMSGFVADGFDFIPDYEAERHLDDDGRVRWFAFPGGSLRARIEQGELRILPFSPDDSVNLLVFNEGRRLFLVEVGEMTAEESKKRASELEALIPGPSRPLTLRWKGRLIDFQASSHAGELAHCRIDPSTVILMLPHAPATEERPATVALDLVRPTGSRRLAVCPLVASDILWSSEEETASHDASRPPPSEESARRSRRADRPDARASASSPSTRRTKAPWDARVRRAYGRFLDHIANGIADREAIKLRRALPPILLRLAERGIRLRGLGGELKRKMEEGSGMKIPFGPRTFSGAIRILFEHTPLVRGEARPRGRTGERVLPFDELHNPNSEISRWLLHKFPDEPDEADHAWSGTAPPESPPPEPPSSTPPSPSTPPPPPSHEVRAHEPSSDDASHDHQATSDGEASRPPSPTTTIDTNIKRFLDAHHEREAREAAERSASAPDDPMREVFMTRRPFISAPLEETRPRGPPGKPDD